MQLDVSVPGGGVQSVHIDPSTLMQRGVMVDSGVPASFGQHPPNGFVPKHMLGGGYGAQGGQGGHPSPTYTSDRPLSEYSDMSPQQEYSDMQHRRQWDAPVCH